MSKKCLVDNEATVFWMDFYIGRRGGSFNLKIFAMVTFPFIF